jgi:diguanylate cyclase
VVDQSVKTWGIPAGDVVLELPESAMIADAEKSMAILTRLKGTGVQLALDEFGSGFTSLGGLRRFPFDEIKVGGAFVAAMQEQQGDAALVRSAIDIAHHFGLRAVALGVGDSRIRDELRGLRCEAAQGALFADPMPEPQLRDWWRRSG